MQIQLRFSILLGLPSSQVSFSIMAILFSILPHRGLAITHNVHPRRFSNCIEIHTWQRLKPWLPCFWTVWLSHTLTLLPKTTQHRCFFCPLQDVTPLTPLNIGMLA